MVLYIAALIAVGIILLVLEILIIPGMIAGIIGVLFIVVAIAWTFNEYGATAGIYTAVASTVATAASIYISLRSKAWSRFSLKDDLSASRANLVDSNSISEGDTGITLSALRPMGTVMIGSLKVEARTNGEHIQQHTAVTVLKVLPNGVLVRQSASSA